MPDLTVDRAFLARASTMSRDEKIKALYCRVTGIKPEEIADVPLSSLEEQLQDPDYAYFYRQVLALDETYTI
jgi:hypothetical protein